jgi:hypothetical protein
LRQRAIGDWRLEIGDWMLDVGIYILGFEIFSFAHFRESIQPFLVFDAQQKWIEHLREAE